MTHFLKCLWCYCYSEHSQSMKYVYLFYSNTIRDIFKKTYLTCLRIELSAVKNNGFDSTVMNWYIDQVSAEISVYDLIHPILSSQYTCIINMLGKSSAFYQYLMFTNLLTRCTFSLYNLK